MAEPTAAWRLGDGTWVKLFRDNGKKRAKSLRESEESKSRRNYASFSFDDGKTWTRPTRTNFPDACSRSNAGRLPDGQVYVINNVLPIATKQGGRSLLAISLSRDGLNFDRVAALRFVAPPMRFEGRSKVIGYQYPHSVVVGDDLWAIYSVNKEDIEIARIPVSELESIGDVFCRAQDAACLDGHGDGPPASRGGRNALRCSTKPAGGAGSQAGTFFGAGIQDCDPASLEVAPGECRAVWDRRTLGAHRTHIHCGKVRNDP